MVAKVVFTIFFFKSCLIFCCEITGNTIFCLKGPFTQVAASECRKKSAIDMQDDNTSVENLPFKCRNRKILQLFNCCRLQQLFAASCSCNFSAFRVCNSGVNSPYNSDVTTKSVIFVMVSKQTTRFFSIFFEIFLSMKCYFLDNFFFNVPWPRKQTNELLVLKFTNFLQ